MCNQKFKQIALSILFFFPPLLTVSHNFELPSIVSGRKPHNGFPWLRPLCRLCRHRCSGLLSPWHPLPAVSDHKGPRE